MLVRSSPPLIRLLRRPHLPCPSAPPLFIATRHRAPSLGSSAPSLGFVAASVGQLRPRRRTGAPMSGSKQWPQTTAGAAFSGSRPLAWAQAPPPRRRQPSADGAVGQDGGRPQTSRRIGASGPPEVAALRRASRHDGGRRREATVPPASTSLLRPSARIRLPVTTTDRAVGAGTASPATPARAGGLGSGSPGGRGVAAPATDGEPPLPLPPAVPSSATADLGPLSSSSVYFGCRTARLLPPRPHLALPRAGKPPCHRVWLLAVRTALRRGRPVSGRARPCRGCASPWLLGRLPWQPNKIWIWVEAERWSGSLPALRHQGQG